MNLFRSSDEFQIEFGYFILFLYIIRGKQSKDLTIK